MALTGSDSAVRHPDPDAPDGYVGPAVYYSVTSFYYL